MSTMTRETQIVSDPDVPLIRITREFDAPAEKVFRAHVDPDLIVQWLGPRDLEMTIDHFDCRTGGSYRYLHTRGDEDYAFHGCFHEVRPSELGDGRTRLVGTSLVDSFEARDAFVASGMETGVVEGYERLDELLAG